MVELNFIAGLPISGKSTLMRKIRALLGEHTNKQHNLLRYEDYLHHVILGVYDGTTFEGTDRLSMAVINDTLDFLKTNRKNVLVEGDRLFNKKFLEGAVSLGYDVKITILYVDNLPEILKRYQQRGQMQSESFITGRQTKINNLRLIFPTESINTSHPLKSKTINSFI